MSSALADAIVRLAGDADRARAYGSAARRRALELFSADAAADGVAPVYDDLLESRSPRRGR